MRADVSLPEIAWLEFRRSIWERDGGICGLCGDPVAFDNIMHIDHIVSLKHGGGHERENLQATHRQCNIKKGAGASPHVPMPTPRRQPVVIHLDVDDSLARVTVGELAAIMRVNPKTVREWIKKGMIKRATMVNRRAGWLIPRSEVDRLLLENQR